MGYGVQIEKEFSGGESHGGGMCWSKKKSLDLRSPQVGISAIGKYGSLQPRLQSMADKF